MQYIESISKPRKSVVTFLLLTLVTWSLGLPSFINRAHAASLTFVSDTLSETASSTPSNHTIVFTSPSGLSAGQNFTVEFDPTGSAFDLTAIDDTDIDLDIDGADQTIAAAPSGATWGVVAAGDTITFTSGTGVIPVFGTTTIKIGKNAAGGAANAQIVNPTTNGSYVIRIAGGMTDSGDTRVLMLNHVKVTASVETIFEFDVQGVLQGVNINGEVGAANQTSASSTAQTLPFGILTPNVTKMLAQELRVKTNALHGYAVTVQADGNLLSATGADINPFKDNSAVATPEAWAAPTATIDTDTTYGHEGITSEDADLNTNEYGTGLYAGNFVATPRVILSHDGPVTWSGDYSTPATYNPDKATTRVGYRIEISALQEAATDYTQSLHYVATPTF